MSLKHSSIFLILITFAIGCANPFSPSGGPKDVTPPEMDLSLSTPNEQTNFKEREIQLEFNEWIQLDNAYGQLVVSPPLEFRPEIKARGKTLIFRFDEREVLLDSVTYTINFGSAVKDNTEGNNVKDLRFVFSTGPEIDSLEFGGIVIDAFSSEPVQEIPVLLFPPGPDSLVFHEKPFYYCTTDKNGSFRFFNLREGKYRIIALKDENNNLKYDLPTEGIAFQKDPVMLPDTSSSKTQLKYSLPAKYEALTSNDFKDSLHMVIGFAGELKKKIRIINLDQSILFDEIVRDSLHIWIDDADLWPDSLIIEQGTENDTIRLGQPSGTLTGFQVRGNNVKGGKHAPQLDFHIDLNQPVSATNVSRINIVDTSDSFIPFNCQIDTPYMKRLRFEASWKEGQLYKLEILPGALSHWNGTTARDTLILNISTGNRDDFGRLILNISGMKSDTRYWLQLLDNSGQVAYETGATGSDSGFQIDLDGQFPGQYSLRVIVDDNENEKWDSGNYWKGRQPEQLFNIPLGELRANWELKLDVPLPEGE